MSESNKFKELVHYICELRSGCSSLGATKLNKVLFYIDYISYRDTGASITGAKYKKLPYGPAPEAISPTLEELKKENKISVREEAYFGLRKKEFHSLQKPNLSVFTEKQRGLVEFVVSGVCDGHTATSISERSHDAAWSAAKLGEDIPFAAVLASESAELTSDDIEWAHKAIDRWKSSD